MLSSGSELLPKHQALLVGAKALRGLDLLLEVSAGSTARVIVCPVSVVTTVFMVFREGCCLGE